MKNSVILVVCVIEKETHQISEKTMNTKELAERKVDALIEEHVMGNTVTWTDVPIWDMENGCMDSKKVPIKGEYPTYFTMDSRAIKNEVPRYYRNISYAWKVVRKLEENGYWVRYVTRRSDVRNKSVLNGCEISVFSTDRNEKLAHVVADKAPEAICLAALEAYDITLNLEDL